MTNAVKKINQFKILADFAHFSLLSYYKAHSNFPTLAV